VSRLELKVALAVRDLPADHSAVRSAGAEFDQTARDIPELAGKFKQELKTEPGTKGPGSELLVSLADPAAVAGFARLVTLWLSRDERRSLTLTVPTGTLRLTGGKLSPDDVRRAVERLGGDQP
jgi:hypothetical protein